MIDRTNLAGGFGFELRYGPELFPIGLALRAARTPIDIIIIDGAHRPTEN